MVHINKKEEKHIWGFDLNSSMKSMLTPAAYQIEFEGIPTARDIIQIVEKNFSNYSFITKKDSRWDTYTITTYAGMGYLITPSIEVILYKYARYIDDDITEINGERYVKHCSFSITVSNIHRLD